VSDANGKSNYQFVPTFWREAEFYILVHLVKLGIRDEDADVIADDIINRCAQIDPVLPIGPNENFYTDYASLICDAVSAGQRLFATKHGRMSGELLDDCAHRDDPGSALASAIVHPWPR
jgi:hypothetical protein